MSITSKRNNIDQNSRYYKTTYGNNMFTQDGYSSRESVNQMHGG